MKELHYYLLLPALLLSLTDASASAALAKPNVLFIALDDLNDWDGCLGGHPQTKTPNLDRLARSGVHFANAHCPAPACNPSRTAVFSGVPPYRSGLYNNTQKLRDVLPRAELLPRHFSRNGYWSAGSGKLLHYIIDPQSWDDYFPEKSKDDPFPRTFDPPNRPISLPVGGPWQYRETDWAALDVTFINSREESVELFWMTPDGGTKSYGLIAPAKTKRQQTRPGAVWEIRSANKTRLGSFVIGDRTAKAVIPDGEGTPSKSSTRKP
jgi:arylsulfatase A-like enzyme